MLYCKDTCPCLNTECDLYQNCDACIERHHSSEQFPYTACEICEREGCERADPREHKA